MAGSAGQGTGEPDGTDLGASARGWHRVQLAVLGFIGLCGVLNDGGSAGNPRWLQLTAGLLVLSALVLQCLAIAVVATVAWPLREQPHDGRTLERDRRRVRRGIATTFVAVGVLALGTISSWWPTSEPGAGHIRVVTSVGILCGRVQDSEPGRLALVVDGRTFVLALGDVSGLQVVDSCD